MNGFISSVENILTWLQPVTWVLVAVSLVVIGIMCTVGSQESREKAKKSLPWVAIGAILILGAIFLAKEFVGNINF